MDKSVDYREQINGCAKLGERREEMGVVVQADRVSLF